MENLEIVLSDRFLGCIFRENNPQIKKAVEATYKKLVQSGVKGSNLQFERLRRAKAEFHTVRAGKGPRIVGLKKDGKFILIHVDKHDDAHSWAERQPRDIKYKVTPITEAGLESAFNSDEEYNQISEVMSEVCINNADESLDDIIGDFAKREQLLILDRDRAKAERDRVKAELSQAKAERDHMYSVASEIEDGTQKDTIRNKEAERKYSAIIEAQEDTIAQLETELSQAKAAQNDHEIRLNRQTESLQRAQPLSSKPITGFSKNEILEDVFVIIDQNKKAIALKLLDNDTLRLNNWQNGFDLLLKECQELIGSRIKTDVWGNYSAQNWFQNIYLVSTEKTNSSTPLGTRSGRLYFKQNQKQDNQIYDDKICLWFIENYESVKNFDAVESQSSDKIYLNCPFEEKDECKSLGAHWDNETRKWYIWENQAPEPFYKWLSTGSASTSSKTITADKSKFIYLNCPFEDKDKCKTLGGKWDAQQKRWYVPEGVDTTPFTKWLER